MESEDFQGDPYGAITNQSGHFILGLNLGYAASFLLPQITAVLLVTYLYFLVAEVLLQKLKMPTDSFIDMAFVATGVAFASYVPHQWEPAVILMAFDMLLLREWERRS